MAEPMNPADGSDGGVRGVLLLPSALFLLFFAYALFQSAPHLTGGDSGEYVTAGAYLGNTHPPGNPVHHMLSYLAQRLPFGDAFFRSAMLSCLSAAFAVAVACLLLLSSGTGPVAAAGASLLLGFSPAVMRNALVTEVYTLLLAVCAGQALLFLRLRRDRGTADPGPRGLLLLAFATGLGMGVHYFTAFFALPLLLCEWIGGGDRGKRALACAALFLCGFLVMLYLPARSLAHPPADYGSPSTLRSFLHAITWREYISRPAEARSLALVLSQAVWSLESLLRSLSPAAFPLAGAGLVRVYRKREAPWAIPVLAGGGLLFLANVALQNFPSRIMTLSETPRFLGPACIPLCLLAGLGFQELADRASAYSGSNGPRRAVRHALAGMFLLVVAVSGWRSAHLHSRSGDFVVRDYLREAFLSLPPNAAVFAEGDTPNFSALAVHFVERLRTDTLPIDRTGSHLASIYDAGPVVSGPLGLERFRARREMDFLGSYPFDVAYFQLPDWLRQAGTWASYGRIYLAGDVSRTPYHLPTDGPIRFGSNAATAYDLKTRLFLSGALYQELLAPNPDPSTFREGASRIMEIAWDNPSFFALHGTVLVGLGDLEGGERYLRHALSIYPPLPEGKKSLGTLLARTRRYGEARSILSDPELEDFAEGQFYLGNILLHENLPAEAVQRYERAASLGFRTPMLLNNLGVAHVRAGEKEKAFRSFREALRIDPGYRGALENLQRLSEDREGK